MPHTGDQVATCMGTVMDVVNRKSGRIGWQMIAVAPLMLMLVAGVGIAGGAAKGAGEHAILSAIVGIAMGVAAAVGGFQMVRRGHVRHIGVATLIGIVCALLVIGTSRYVGWQTAEEGAKAGKGYAEYRTLLHTNGVTTGFKDYPLKGGWWTACLWIEAILLVLSCVLVSFAAVVTPYCEDCKSWARKAVWSFSLTGPEEMGLLRFRQEKSIQSLTGIQRTSRPAKDRLVIKVKGCICGGVATMYADHEKPDHDGNVNKDQILIDEAIDSGALDKMLTWAESLDASMRDKRPTLRLKSVSRDMFGKPVCDPEFGGFTLYRSGSMIGRDNIYTDSLREFMRAERDWEVAEAAINAQRDINDRAAVVDALGDWKEPPAWIEEWVRARPSSASAALVKGGALLHWAWDARGASWTPKDWPVFFQRLQQAKAELERAAALDPKDPIAWASLIPVCKGIQEEQSTIKRMFKESIARNPLLCDSYHALADAIASKWGGSDDEAIAFARQAASKSPQGTAIATVVIVAHENRVMMLSQETGGSAKAYWADPRVMDDIRQAAAKCFPDQGARWSAYHDKVSEDLIRALKRIGDKGEAKRVAAVVKSRRQA